jgi:hypothetical protein
LVSEFYPHYLKKKGKMLVMLDRKKMYKEVESISYLSLKKNRECVLRNIETASGKNEI